MEVAGRADALRTWRARLDLGVQFVGGTVAFLGGLAQLVGVVLGLGFDDPLTGEQWITAGFEAAMVGGAGLAYGLQVDAGGAVLYPGGPVTYSPPKRRWPAVVWSILLAPAWGVFSLPVSALLLGMLLLGGCVFGGEWLYKRIRGRS
jgi:hypothetical protein